MRSRVGRAGRGDGAARRRRRPLVADRPLWRTGAGPCGRSGPCRRDLCGGRQQHLQERRRRGNLVGDRPRSANVFRGRLTGRRPASPHDPLSRRRLRGLQECRRRRLVDTAGPGLGRGAELDQRAGRRSATSRHGLRRHRGRGRQDDRRRRDLGARPERHPRRHFDQRAGHPSLVAAHALRGNQGRPCLDLQDHRWRRLLGAGRPRQSASVPGRGSVQSGRRLRGFSYGSGRRSR